MKNKLVSQNYQTFSVLLMIMFVFSFSLTINTVKAEESTEAPTPQLISTNTETEDELSNVIEIVSKTESEDEEIVNVSDFSDEELTEAEPSDIPEAKEDPALTERLFGKMLLDVEGNGEVYYLDPVTGGKEYLADGSAAQKLLERRALGINEQNFANLIIGTEKEEESVCKTSKLSNRLKGRIVLRVEKNGEAYWINPNNCKAYYAGTHEASYELMKKMSLGVKKNDLAKIKDNKRQQIKTAYRYTLYAHAEDKDLSLEEAKKNLNDQVKEMTRCLKGKKELNKNTDKKEEREYAKTCVMSADIPRINKERREQIKETIAETRTEKNTQDNNGNKKNLLQSKVNEAVKRAMDKRMKIKESKKLQDQKENKLENMKI
ncbi:hypothetical protein ISS03_01205 [Patescibacteria group bacterium]|nr:hypothetical protein [Patescibacteria group bacterium]